MTLYLHENLKSLSNYSINFISFISKEVRNKYNKLSVPNISMHSPRQFFSCLHSAVSPTDMWRGVLWSCLGNRWWSSVTSATSWWAMPWSPARRTPRGPGHCPNASSPSAPSHHQWTMVASGYATNMTLIISNVVPVIFLCLLSISFQHLLVALSVFLFSHLAIFLLSFPVPP